MNIVEYLKSGALLLDGGTGSILQSQGLEPGEAPELWNITHPDIIRQIHKSYFDAGSNVVCTNTFGANSLKYSPEALREIIGSAVENARIAAAESTSGEPKWVALDIGPSGRMLKPIGDLDFEEAVKVFSEVVKLGVEFGVDLIFIETMSDSYETKAALLAAKENSDLPVFVSNAYGSDGKLLTGASCAAMVAMLEGLGADAIGVNCSLGPDALLPVVKEYLKYSSLPVIVKPNAGLPDPLTGTYSLDCDAFCDGVVRMFELGARVLGGCCGTTPDHISALKTAIRGRKPLPIEKKDITIVSSYTHAVEFDARPVLIGERINPTGKPKFKQALKDGDLDYILREGLSQESAGAHILDVNVGLADIDECSMLVRVVSELQAVTDLPLQIDSSDPVAMEKALRIYNGKPMINSVSGKQESMDAIFPLVKKYGGLVVALTLDESGIPETAIGRLKIAEKILLEAEKYGIEKKDIIFDPLAMAVSADPNAAKETLRALKLINSFLFAKTILGVSNVSFGLPRRGLINSTFFAMAMENRLSAAIMNPHSAEMMATYKSAVALYGLDEGFNEFIAFSENTSVAPSTIKSEVCDLDQAIIKGLRGPAAELTRALLGQKEALEVINQHIIPALSTVGDAYEQKKIYLPGLLMSAEAASAAFEVIKSTSGGKNVGEKGRVVLATVKGDVHDIGKNILKLILENYGYSVTDLGKNVDPHRISDEAARLNASAIGLSALMTTTLPAMEESVRLVRKSLPNCKIMVGGAVVNQEYADRIGADFYGADALSAVRYLDENI